MHRIANPPFSDAFQGSPGPSSRLASWTAMSRLGTRAVMYDFVVVGGGSAGCVIASRLTEDPDIRVLLVEAGGARGPDAMTVPALWPMLIGTPLDWGSRTVPQQNSTAAVSGLSTWACAGRLEQHQCNGVPAGPPLELRQLGQRRR